jgi:pantoate--beta-alanine ligase
MHIIEKVSEMQAFAKQARKQGQTIALVPTMGYLHIGHTSLIAQAKQKADIVITTLFVNPTQFGPNEDYDKYPRNFDNDFKLAKENGSDVLFCPNALEMYPIGYNAEVHIKKVTEPFEGEFRPGHFTGVATVVAKLFNATLPDFAFFGQKDYQQTLLIKRLVIDLNFPIEIIIAPTVREFDGLAMSSRNVYLSKEERKIASILFVALESTKRSIEQGTINRKIINALIIKSLRVEPTIRIEYAQSALADSLDTPEDFLPGDEIVLLIAVYLGKTRLIDNMLVKIPYQLSKDDNFKIG